MNSEDIKFIYSVKAVFRSRETENPKPVNSRQRNPVPKIKLDQVLCPLKTKEDLEDSMFSQQSTARGEKKRGKTAPKKNPVPVTKVEEAMKKEDCPGCCLFSSK